jgi:GT2 family glycosyltransferase
MCAACRDYHKDSVFIVIVNWNGGRDTLECLASLANLTFPSFKIVVVDNASTDGSAGMIRKAFPDVTIISTRENLGFAGGCNLGLKYAMDQGANFVWLLNNDTVVEPDTLTQLVRRMQERPSAGMCGSTLVYYHKRTLVQAYGGAVYNKWLGTVRHLGQNSSREAEVNPTHIEKNLDYVIAASLLVSRTLLERVGLLSEDYFLYFEELDWATRAKGLFSLAWAPKSVVYHKEGRSTGGGLSAEPRHKSKMSDYYGIRNRLKFTKRYYPWALPTVYLCLLYTLFNRIRRGQWDRIKMIFRLL